MSVVGHLRGRRHALAILAQAGTAFAVAAHAQAVPVVGFMRSASFDGAAPLVAAFRDGLREAGFVEGRNVAIEFRSADGHNDRLPAVAAALVEQRVSVIFGNSVAILAARSATSAIPLVFASGGDPVREGLVASLNRPGGNVTGVNFLNSTLSAKQLELLRELIPNLRTVGILLDATNAAAVSMAADAAAAARTLGIQFASVPASSAEQIDAAFARFQAERVEALYVAGAAFFVSRMEQIVALSARHRLPTVYENREYVVGGGLMSYSGSITDGYRQAGVYVGRILGGASPADLPVVLGTRIEFAINLRTARALGITIPPTLLVRADEVIE